MAGVSGQIEGGQLLLLEDAPWLGEFLTELLGFPNARHDDQADALRQLGSTKYSVTDRSFLNRGLNDCTTVRDEPRPASDSKCDRSLLARHSGHSGAGPDHEEHL